MKDSRIVGYGLDKIKSGMIVSALLSLTVPISHAAEGKSCSDGYKGLSEVVAPTGAIRTFGTSNSEAVESELTRLQALLPNLTPAQISAKIEACPSAFFFYRSFVPLRFRLLKELPDFEKTYTPLLGKDQAGWAFGDVHPENFGYLLKENGKPHFTMNDYDDNAHAPLVVDILSFLGASRAAEPSFDAKKLLAAYKSGLKGEDRVLPQWLKDLEAKAEKNGRAPQGKYYDKDSKRLVRSDVTREVTANERKAVEEALTRAYGKETPFEFQDAVFFIRPQGGSGGLNRYEVLLKVPAEAGTDKKHVVVEMKELARPGLSEFQVGPSLTPQVRMETALEYSQGSHSSRYYDVQVLDGRPMLLRPRWDGNSGVSLEDIPAAQRQSVLDYEAYTLGKLHLKSADSIAAYSQAFFAFPEETLLQTGQSLADANRAEFAKVRAAP